ncbi:hypothetical protein [Spongiactinospora sp. TRM90649]|uniref:hypothetical protein n=1 Tax=Spongiactinospora sp. TRM90649 TaxID=3031114 RepID=UPI0023F9BD4D|nr:hypothetical protein [Spongiactinospora sp. TRM90649]MDF5752441.1 hypothetical protein [Spongiactinospora sp. TRM90649]
MVARLLAALLLLLIMTGSAAPAAADPVAGGADARFAQSIGGADVTVVVSTPTRVPAVLGVEVIAYAPVPRLDLALAVRSAESGAVTRDVVRLLPGRPGVYRATALRASHAGPHELELRAGGQVSTLPFRVLVASSSPWEFVIHGGLYAAGILLVGGLLTGGLSRRPSGVAVVSGAVLGVAALTTALLSSWLPLPVAEGAAPPVGPAVPTGRPYVTALAVTEPANPRPEQEFTLVMDLFDGSTGLPADDLTVHHAALAHLVVTGADGAYFRHAHPLRAAPGRLAVRLRAGAPGRYLAYAEIEREGAGRQSVRAAFTVAGRTGTAGEPVHAPAAVPGLTITPARPVAGRPTTFAFAAGGGVQTWLGMAGHLVVRDLPGTLLGHAHEMGSMIPATPGVPPPGEGTATGSPVLRFTYAFPKPGRYLAWVQYARGFRIETVPFEVTVTEEDRTR